MKEELNVNVDMDEQGAFYLPRLGVPRLAPDRSDRFSWRVSSSNKTTIHLTSVSVSEVSLSWMVVILTASFVMK